MPSYRAPLPDYRFALTELFDAGRLDARIGQIYGGTNHVPALDVVGRKLHEDGGRLARRYADLLESALVAAGGEPRLAEFAEPVAAAEVGAGSGNYDAF